MTPSKRHVSIADHWLTYQEVALLRSIAAGEMTKTIARERARSRGTVTKQIQTLYEKIGVPNRAAAAAFAVRHGIAE